MTPQERELISGLFDRLSRLEQQPRDPQAERAISEGLRSAPNAIYPLVQTVLVQDEALKAANAHIEQLQSALGQTAEGRQPGFLDSIRESLFGRGEERRGGSVPSVGSAPRPNYAPPPVGGGYAQAPGAGYGQAPGGGYAQAPGAGGSSFLGTAAATAAGMVGGSLLLNGIRSMFGGGGYGHGAFAGTFDSLAGNPDSVTDASWSGRDDLAADAGYNDIGGDADGPGLVDTADSDTDGDASFDGDFDSGSDDT
jgi:uncharacterized protein